jgi:hypothetical protein
MTRVSILIAHDKTLEHGQHLFATNQKVHEAYANYRYLIQDQMAANDWCLLQIVDRDQPMDKFLIDESKVREVASVLREAMGCSCDIQASLVQSYGHVMRLAGFCQLVYDAVNKVETLKGSTVIANVEVLNC